MSHFSFVAIIAVGCIFVPQNNIVAIRNTSFSLTTTRRKDKNVLYDDHSAQMISDKGKTTGFKYEDFNLDNIRTAHFIYRIDSMAPRAGVNLALKEYYRQLINQPRTDEGVYWHKQIYHDQVWLDGIFMGLPYKTMAAPYMVAEGLTVANKGIPTKKDKPAKRDANGTISLTDCVSVSGLGPESSPQRDGTFEYYMSEPLRDNDAKGVGPFLWATLEMESLGYDTSSSYK